MKRKISTSIHRPTRWWNFMAVIPIIVIYILLSAFTVFAASVTLTWDAPTTNSDNTPLTDLSGYRAYMSTTSGQYSSSNIVKNNIPASSPNGGVTETTTVDNLPNGTYYFVVTAYDIYGNESGYSNEIQKTTTSGGGDTQAPTVPTGLSGQAISSSQINLSWTASTDNVGVTGYRIYRNNALIDTSPTNSYSNTGLSASTTYTYAVSAYDAAGNVSSQSASASATTSSGGNHSANSAGGDTISGGGCGFVKDDSDRPNSDKGQFAMNMAMLLLSLLFIRMWRLWRPKWASFLILGVLLFLPNVASAVNLPWSTTYNCPDWTQSNGLYNVNCDGLTGHGSWITSDGKEEQITSAANYSGGAGGKGQRHWLGDAPVDNSGGTRIQFTSPQSELWIRWYMRFQTGFQWNVLIEYKAFIVDMGLGPTQTIIGWRWQDSVGIVVNGNPYDSQSGGWNTTMVNGSTDARGNKMSDGQWHLYEVHMKMDTNGNNGIVEYFVDGARWLYRTDVNYGASAGWSYMVIGDNGGRVANGVPYAYYVDYDDIVISTSGPIGGTLPDKIAPSPASGLQ